MKEQEEMVGLQVVVMVLLIMLSVYSVFFVIHTSVVWKTPWLHQCEKTYRGDYVFPARKLGCWLGEKVD